MIEAEPGTLLDDARPIGKDVYASRVIDNCFINSTNLPTRSSSGICCPACGEIVVVTKFKVPHPVYKNADKEPVHTIAFYCSNCWLLFEIVVIGTLDSDGNYYPYEE